MIPQPQEPSEAVGRVVGRYAIFDEIASGGMAAVYFGRLMGPAGFARTVAIKQLHSEFARDPDFVTMLLDEARLAARIRHPNVVSTLDVVVEGAELFLVMDYVEGESLSRIRRAAHQIPMPLPYVSAIMTGVLLGLHAAHEAKSEQGEPLHIVHRDVSPQNILVGADGTPRVADFGVAKAAGRANSTRDGQVKGKAGYMAPEQLRGDRIDRRVDVYAASVVLWELITGRRLFMGETPAETMLMALEQSVEAPSRLVPGVPRALDEVVMCGLERNANLRFTTALDMATALEHAVRPATAREVANWVKVMVGDVLRERADRVADIESGLSGSLGAAGTRSGSAPAAMPRADRAQELASQVSSISVATPKAARAPRGGSVGWGLGALAIALLTVIGIVIGGRWLHGGAAADPIRTPPPGAPGTDPFTVMEAPPPAPPTTPTLTSTSPTTGAAATVGVVDAGPPPKIPSRPRKRSPDCNPPYKIDPSGFHIAKPECL